MKWFLVSVTGFYVINFLICFMDFNILYINDISWKYLETCLGKLLGLDEIMRVVCYNGINNLLRYWKPYFYIIPLPMTFPVNSATWGVSRNSCKAGEEPSLSLSIPCFWTSLALDVLAFLELWEKVILSFVSPNVRCCVVVAKHTKTSNF